MTFLFSGSITLHCTTTVFLKDDFNSMTLISTRSINVKVCECLNLLHHTQVQVCDLK